MKPFIIDAHEDISFNMQVFKRDYSLTLSEVRAKDTLETIQTTGTSLLSIDEFRKGNIGIVFATLFAAPYNEKTSKSLQFHYRDSNEAYQLIEEQIQLYQQLFAQNSASFHPLRNQIDLTQAISQNPLCTNSPIYLMLSIEGADCVRSLDDLDYFWKTGVRAIGPAWSRTKFCGGTDEPGGLTPEGHELLKKMNEIGFILDISHMDWLAIHQSFDTYEGTIIGSHVNPLEKVPNGTRNRFLPDNLIRKLVKRDGVMGIIPYNNFIYQYWSLSEKKPLITIDHVVEHIDHICQLAGNSRHVGIGSDFDGGFGAELTPDGINSVADLQLIGDKLFQKGYTSNDVENILSQNWLRILRQCLP
ncbi:MAG TPA: membrane dipeptidase [Anaerolineales bacterium]|nr:membrane dipeptidase [Anaerolineales bacterium]